MPALRLLLLCFSVAALADVLAGLLWAPMLFFTAVVSYPIAVVVTLAFVIPLHRVFSRRHVNAPRQLLFVLPLGALGGFAVHLTLAAPNVVVSGALSSRLAIEYAAFGLFAALLCWALYNWGPLRLRP
jgi:hypothetical protein